VSDPIALDGGATADGLIRIGDTVRRPAGAGSRRMRDVLVHLERAGFDAAPRWLGVDEQGRDVLSWIEGETFADRGALPPYLDDAARRVTFSDEQVAAAFRLLRRYHDAFEGGVICHGDFGPWNLVWRGGLPVAIIDFESVEPGDPSTDVAYALRMFVAYGRAAAGVDELVRRTHAALAGYGSSFDVPRILEREYDRAEERCRRNGWTRQLAVLPLERAWVAANRSRLL
jgi:Ser/Thr protein kinase RdoA (MazF antagonist)